MTDEERKERNRAYNKVYRKSHRNDFRSAEDRERNRAYHRAYYQSHKNSPCSDSPERKEQKRVYNKAYRESHRDYFRFKRKAYWETHKEKEKEQIRAYRREHAGELADYGRDYKKNHPEMVERHKLVYLPMWRMKNPEKMKNISLKAHLKRTYKMTVEEYEELVEAQGGVCAICQQTCDMFDRLSVDHDHDTGVVRGLLCDRCNKAVGLLMDSPERADALANYLRRSVRLRLVQ